jgi:hypothetical protein
VSARNITKNVVGQIHSSYLVSDAIIARNGAADNLFCSVLGGMLYLFIALKLQEYHNFDE